MVMVKNFNGETHKEGDLAYVVEGNGPYGTDIYYTKWLNDGDSPEYSKECAKMMLNDFKESYNDEIKFRMYLAQVNNFGSLERVYAWSIEEKENLIKDYLKKSYIKFR